MNRSVALIVFVLLARSIGALAATAAVSRTSTGVVITFPHGVHLTVKTDGDRVAGLTQVEVAGHLIRSPQFAAHPVFKLADGTRYASCHLASIKKAGETVTLQCTLQPQSGGEEDRFDWVFEPRRETVRDRDYVGFAYRYAFRSPTRKLEEILDLSTLEIDGDIDGKYVQPGGLATRSGSFCSPRSWAFASTPWFRFQCGPSGMLYDAYENVSPVISWLEKRANSPNLHTFDVVQQEMKQEGGTPFRRILFCSARDCRGLQCVDEYTKVYDHLERRARAEFGISDPEYLPMVLAAQRTDQTFDLQSEDLAGIAELGFKGVWTCALESVSTKIAKRKMADAGIYSLEAAEILGGTDGLRRLVDAAHRCGMRVYTWAPGGQLYSEGEELKAHPEWLLRVPPGQSRPLAGSTDLHSGYYDYAIRKYGELHRATGMDGVWFDSFNAAAMAIQVRDDGSRYFQVREAFQMVADTQKVGVRNIQIEAAGPAGQYALTCGYLSPGEPLCYKMSHYVYSCRTEELNYYYRWIANKAFPMLPYRYILWTYEYRSLAQFPELRQQVRRANLDWAAVRDLMVYRRLIASHDNRWKEVGVEWSKPGSGARAVFSYDEFRYHVPTGSRVTDVTTGTVVKCEDTLKTQCCHTYRIER